MANPDTENLVLNEDIQSELSKKADSLLPEFKSPVEALMATQKKLEILASTMKLTVDEFLKQAESSTRHDESFVQGLALARQIMFYKSQVK